MARREQGWREAEATEQALLLERVLLLARRDRTTLGRLSLDFCTDNKIFAEMSRGERRLTRRKLDELAAFLDKRERGGVRTEAEILRGELTECRAAMRSMVRAYDEEDFDVIDSCLAKFRRLAPSGRPVAP